MLGPSRAADLMNSIFDLQIHVTYATLDGGVSIGLFLPLALPSFVEISIASFENPLNALVLVTLDRLLDMPCGGASPISSSLNSI